MIINEVVKRMGEIIKSQATHSALFLDEDMIFRVSKPDMVNT